MNLQIASARRKIAWGYHRLDELKVAVADFNGAHAKSFVVDRDSQEQIAEIDEVVKQVRLRFDDPIPNMVGDVLGNFNAALDHGYRVIFDQDDLADLRKHYFPVPHAGTENVKWRETVFAMVKDSARWIDAATVINGIYGQIPKNGMTDHPAHWLKEMVNSDKHHLLLDHEALARTSITLGKAVDPVSALSAARMSMADTHTKERFPWANNREFFFEQTFDAYNEVQVDISVEVAVNVKGRREIVGVLEDIGDFVTKAVDSFAGTFTSDP